MKTGIEIIAAERRRQVNEEGFTTEHDDCHHVGELADAAMCYCMSPIYRPANNFPPLGWPWLGPNNDGFKPCDRIKELAKAGALIAAEIDRLQRIEGARNLHCTDDKTEPGTDTGSK
ncbi:hypothetical protein [Chitinophaga nivalis]|uniref:Uncharacterized protein n=1 Tax=Chitinophaga nivalis TaxID=2991709 RepID=A0ABT3IJ33_9BACT|nr:hypothetical protein [Chitinophaga nivalis]MCW3466550.1 hypothetical protein [Chitinophaga nivalis]MCW3483759.1 hypothetical protein [Chitinophaga nivalis]